MAYWKRTTVSAGSKPTVANAPTEAIATATAHSRAASRNRLAGTVIITASTAARAHVITAAPVLARSSSRSSTTTPTNAVRVPKTTGRPPVRAARAQT